MKTTTFIGLEYLEAKTCTLRVGISCIVLMVDILYSFVASSLWSDQSEEFEGSCNAQTVLGVISSLREKIDSTSLSDSKILVVSWIWEIILVVFTFKHCLEKWPFCPQRWHRSEVFTNFLFFLKTFHGFLYVFFLECRDLNGFLEYFDCLCYGEHEHEV